MLTPSGHTWQTCTYYRMVWWSDRLCLDVSQYGYTVLCVACMPVVCYHACQVHTRQLCSSCINCELAGLCLPLTERQWWVIEVICRTRRGYTQLPGKYRRHQEIAATCCWYTVHTHLHRTYTHTRMQGKRQKHEYTVASGIKRCCKLRETERCSTHKDSNRQS